MNKLLDNYTFRMDHERRRDSPRMLAKLCQLQHCSLRFGQLPSMQIMGNDEDNVDYSHGNDEDNVDYGHGHDDTDGCDVAALSLR